MSAPEFGDTFIVPAGTTDPESYKDCLVQDFAGRRYTVVRANNSEPDGYGGFLVDLYLSLDGAPATIWPNLSAEIIEQMMTAAVES